MFIQTNFIFLVKTVGDIIIKKNDQLFYCSSKLIYIFLVKTVGDIILKKNNQLAYCPPELVGKHAKEYYQVVDLNHRFKSKIIILSKPH